MSIKASIIVLNYNGKEDTIECLNSLKKTRYPKKEYEIIIVDNKSDDGSIEEIKKRFVDSNIRIKVNKKNFGYAEGNNIGARMARGELLIFLNNDTIVDENWLNPLIEKMNDGKIGVCMPKILYYYGKKKEIINTFGGGMTLLGVPYLIGEGEKSSKFNASFPVFWASGCCLVIKKSLFLEIGGFDKSFFLYAEDLDLSWRVWNEGYKILTVPNSRIYHKGGKTLKRIEKGKFGPRYYYFQNRNVIKTIIKNSPTKYLIFFLLPSRFFLNIIQAIVLLFSKKDIKITAAIIKGTFEGILTRRKRTLLKFLPYPYILFADFKTTLIELIKKFRKHV